MTLSSFWNRDGQRELLEGLPSSFEHWQVGDDIEPSRRELLNRVEIALSSKIVSTEVRAHDRNLVSTHALSLSITLQLMMHPVYRCWRLSWKTDTEK